MAYHDRTCLRGTKLFSSLSRVGRGEGVRTVEVDQYDLVYGIAKSVTPPL